jgi:hypothetical protein
VAGGNRWLRAALVVVLLPLAVACVALVVRSGDHLPVGDRALTELQIRDVGNHAVLRGLYSRADWAHPGPVMFYLAAPLYRLAGSAAIAVNVVAVAINTAAIAGMVLIARRRGGVPLAVATLAALSLLVRALGVDFLSDPWNTYVTVLPFGLMVLLTWSMLCGDRWALPVGVLVASFLAQTHVGFVALALPLLGLARRGSWSARGARRRIDTIGSSSPAWSRDRPRWRCCSGRRSSSRCSRTHRTT